LPLNQQVFRGYTKSNNQWQRTEVTSYEL
jgi:hypothetical protein